MTSRRKQGWYQDDSFWRVLYPYMFPESRFEGTAEEARRMLRLARPKGKDVLDLCCGPGRFSVDLAKRGYRVTGVDRNRFLLNKARARARAKRAKVEWVTKDMRDFVRPESFDLALSMFTSFGYFKDRRDDLRVLENVCASLRPGGAFVIEVHGKEWLSRHFEPVGMETLPDGALLVQRREFVDDWTRLENDWILIRRGRAKIWRLLLNLYTGEELRDRLERVGFSKVRLYGGLDGRPWGPKAQRLVVVAWKGRTIVGRAAR